MGSSPDSDRPVHPAGAGLRTLEHALPGLLLTPILLIVSGVASAVVGGAVGAVGVEPFDLVAVAVVFVGCGWLCFTLIRKGTYKTCKERPGYPTVIAISHMVGAVPFGLLFAGAGATVPGLVSLGFGISQGLAAYLGSRRGARDSVYGPVAKGVGRTCAACLYDLSATAEGLVCPECGGTMRYERGLPNAER